jgi:biotin operon repressor
MGVINKPTAFTEGEVFVRWAKDRIAKNKNLICVQTGATGSGKSMCDLRKAELLYKEFFNEPFPVKNICFSITELMMRVGDPTMRKGEVLILEEAGVNAGSGDWQNKIVKMFNYLLQSFRSMNLILLMNLPVLGMLSKQARQLVHMHMATVGIDFETKTVKVKALAHQLNQSSGDSYWKYLRVKAQGRMQTVERMNFTLPSDELIKQYEAKKLSFLTDMTQGFIQELKKKEQEKLDKLARHELSPIQIKIKELREKDKSLKEIASLVDITPQSVCYHLQKMEKWGYKIETPKEMRKIKELNLIDAPNNLTL